MSYIEGIDRNQRAFLPPSLDEYVEENSLVRVIDVFIDNLDIEGLRFTKASPAKTGRPAYDPRTLLKLYVYGYVNRIRSSRRLALECKRNIEVMFLTGSLTPDFRTIADFRKDNTEAIKGVFSAFVRICANLKLYDGESVAIDGTKVRAQNARAHAYNATSLEKKLANIDRRIQEYLDKLDKSDDEDDDDDIDPDAIAAAIKDLKKREDTYKGYQKRIAEEGISQILTTDEEAHRMKTKDGFNCCYNVQAAVDTTSHLVAGFEVISSPSDQGNLKATADRAREETGKKSLTVIADKGYESSGDIKDCLLNGVVPHVAMTYEKHARIFNLPYKETPITDKVRSSTEPEDIQACLHTGILPYCYEKKGIVIDVQSRDTLSCFTKTEDGTVLCPEGKTLYLNRIRKQKNTEIYTSRKACRECLNRCTDSASAKVVSFGANTDCIPVMVYGSPEHPPQKIPEGAKISPYNHTLDRTDYAAEKKVRVMIPYDRKRLQVRMSTVEHPFGTIKWYNGAHYFLMRGKKKVSAEMSLSFLAYNLKRALNEVGFERLIAAVE